MDTGNAEEFDLEPLITPDISESHEPDERELLRDAVYSPFNIFLDELRTVLQHDPERWFQITYKTLRKAEIHMYNSPEPMCDFLSTYLPEMYRLIHKENFPTPVFSSVHAKRNFIASRTGEFMHQVSNILMRDEHLEYEHKEIHHLSLDELLQGSDRFNITSELLPSGTYAQTLQVYSKSHNAWFGYPLPRLENVTNKGGISRIALKILAGAPDETIEAELPLNDLDWVAAGDRYKILKEAEDMGVDEDGIEFVENLDVNELFNNRDLDLNCCLLDKHGLTYSADAFEAARTGKISIVSTKRGIYGSEIFYHHGIRLIKNRGMMRLMKTVAEGKALSFEFLPLNMQVDFGIYWLVLAKRFSHKEEFGEVVNRLFYLGAQLAQVREDEENILHVLERVHTKYPFFDFDDGKLDRVGLTRWLGSKLIKQIDKKYREKYSVPSTLELKRWDGDTEPKLISLEQYTSSFTHNAFVKDQWRSFLERSRKRTKAYYAQ